MCKVHETWYDYGQPPFDSIFEKKTLKKLPEIVIFSHFCADISKK